VYFLSIKSRKSETTDFIPDPGNRKLQDNAANRSIPIQSVPLASPIPGTTVMGSLGGDAELQGARRRPWVLCPLPQQRRPPPCRARGADPFRTKRGGTLTPTIGATISTRSMVTAEAGVAFFSHVQELSHDQVLRASGTRRWRSPLHSNLWYGGGSPSSHGRRRQGPNPSRQVSVTPPDSTRTPRRQALEFPLPLQPKRSSTSN
jgi:hypothetical protein